MANMTQGPRVTEKRILAVPPQKINADGNRKGRLVVPESQRFMVGQLVQIKDKNGLNKELQVKRILDKFIFLGDKGKKIEARADLSDVLFVNEPTIEAVEQIRPKVPEDQLDKFKFAEEPILADRAILVDKLGRMNALSDYESCEQPSGEPALNVQQRGPLGWVGLQSFIDNFIGGLAYDEVENNIEDDREVLTFRQAGEIVKELTLRYDAGSWFISDSAIPATFDGVILKEDGDSVLTESGDKILVLA